MSIPETEKGPSRRIPDLAGIIKIVTSPETVTGEGLTPETDPTPTTDLIPRIGQGKGHNPGTGARETVLDTHMEVTDGTRDPIPEVVTTGEMTEGTDPGLDLHLVITI